MKPSACNPATSDHSFPITKPRIKQILRRFMNRSVVGCDHNAARSLSRLQSIFPLLRQCSHTPLSIFSPLSLSSRALVSANSSSRSQAQELQERQKFSKMQKKPNSVANSRNHPPSAPSNSHKPKPSLPFPCPDHHLKNPSCPFLLVRESLDLTYQRKSNILVGWIVYEGVFFRMFKREGKRRKMRRKMRRREKRREEMRRGEKGKEEKVGTRRCPNRKTHVTFSFFLLR